MSSQIINSFWIPLLIVMGVGLFVVGLVILGRRMQEQHLQRLQEIAQTLGLHFFPAEQIPSEFVEIIQTMQHKELYWKPYFLMEGRYNSVRAIVFSASRQQGRSRTFRTYILGFFSEPFKRELFVTKGNFLLDIAGRLTGKADFKTGDDTIDTKYFINAENGDEVIPFLHQLQVQDALDELMKSGRVVVNELGVCAQKEGNFYRATAETMRDELVRVTDAVRKIGR